MKINVSLTGKELSVALHLNLADHDADPPSNWVVQKVKNGLWHLNNNQGFTLESFKTKKAAEKAKSSGFYFNLYEKEGRWFRGEPVPDWKPYAEKS